MIPILGLTIGLIPWPEKPSTLLTKVFALLLKWRVRMAWSGLSPLLPLHRVPTATLTLAALPLPQKLLLPLIAWLIVTAKPWAWSVLNMDQWKLPRKWAGKLLGKWP